MRDALGGLAKKLFLMLEGNLLYQTSILTVTSDCCLDSVVVLAEFCQNFEEETGRLEPNLDPSQMERSQLKYLFSAKDYLRA